MPNEYETDTSDGYTTKVKDIPLIPPSGQSGELVRKIIRAELFKNFDDPSQPVRVSILHQKRHSRNDKWKDTDLFRLAKLKAGEEVRLILDCGQTKQLMEVLQDLYEIRKKGLPAGGKTIAVVDTSKATVISGNEERILKELLESEGDNFWNLLEQLKPGLIQAEALMRQHQERSRIVGIFNKWIADINISEGEWQKFFQDYNWIFGHGLDYQFLKCIQEQVNCGGVEMDNKGAPRGDYLMATKAQVGFTVLVEIKTPYTPLFGKKLYRNKAWELGPELTGAVVQMQAQCAQWAEEGSRRNNSERLYSEDIYTYEPKGILVIGSTEQFKSDPNKRSTFERFRRNLQNPQIITFDELLHRAEFMVKEPQNKD